MKTTRFGLMWLSAIGIVLLARAGSTITSL
jgi:hypothetical protein